VRDAAEEVKEGTENFIHGAENKMHNAKVKIEKAIEEIAPPQPAGLFFPILVTFMIGLVLVTRLPNLTYPWLSPFGVPPAVEEDVVIIKEKKPMKKGIDEPVLAALERHEPIVADRVRRRAH